MTTKKIGSEGWQWFIGIVEDVADPLEMGRVKARIINEHDNEIDTDDLEWAHVMLPTTSACVEGVGDTPGLTVGSRVMGFYMDGQEKQIPVIIGSFPTIPDNDVDLHSLSWLHRAKNVIEKKKLEREPDTAYGAEYPFNRVMQTRSGITVEMDDTPENERLHIYHPSGTFIEINSDGRLVIKSTEENYNLVAKNRVEFIGENWDLLVKGNMIADVIGNVDLTVGGKVNADIKGDCFAKIGGDTTIDCSQVKITGDLRVDGSIDVGQEVTAAQEVTAKNIKLTTHKHKGVQSGKSLSGGPV